MPFDVHWPMSGYAHGGSGQGRHVQLQSVWGKPLHDFANPGWQGVPVGQTVGVSTGVGVKASGQPSSRVPTACTMSSTLTGTPGGMPCAQADGSSVPSAMSTRVTRSATVTACVPLQSPRHPDGGAGLGVGVCAHAAVAPSAKAATTRTGASRPCTLLTSTLLATEHGRCSGMPSSRAPRSDA
jgi:hypothetical protein